MDGGAKKRRTTKPSPSPMLSDIDTLRRVSFEERVRQSVVAEFANELNNVHAELMSKGAVSTKDAVFADLLKKVDDRKIKAARTTIYRMLMADSAFFAYKSPTSRNPKYAGHVFGTREFLDHYGVRMNSNSDINADGVQQGVLLWSGIKPQSDTRKAIVFGLVNCCSIQQRRGKKKKKDAKSSSAAPTTTRQSRSARRRSRSRARQADQTKPRGTTQQTLPSSSGQTKPQGTAPRTTRQAWADTKPVSPSGINLSMFPTSRRA